MGLFKRPEDIRKGIALTLFEANSGQRSLNHGYLTVPTFCRKPYIKKGVKIITPTDNQKKNRLKSRERLPPLLLLTILG
jgi:hypothetical protein